MAAPSETSGSSDTKTHRPAAGADNAANRYLTSRYLKFCHAGLSEPEHDTFETGKRLVSECLQPIEQADDPELFPPKLFILLVTPAFLAEGRAAHIFGGIRQTLIKRNWGNVALIGSSVSAVIFDGKLSASGAVLACLASRFLDAKVEAIDDISETGKAMQTLASRLGISASGEDPNPEGNRTLLVFFPGVQAGLIAGDLHRGLVDAVQYRIPIFGGISSSNQADTNPLWNDPTVQFNLDGPHQNAVVAALLDANFPIAGSLSRALKKTSRRVTVKSTNHGQIADLEGSPNWAELDDAQRGFLLLGEPGINEQEVVAISTDYQSFRSFRRVNPGDELAVLSVDAENMMQAVRSSTQDSLRRFSIDKPEGCLILPSVGLYRNRLQTGIDFERGFHIMQESTGTDIVGALVDGEIGVEDSGRPVCTYWSTVRLVFGDELTDRSTAKLGYAALASHFPSLSVAKSFAEIVREALLTLRDAGFAGVMISLLIGSDQDSHVVAQDAVGDGFKRILRDTTRKLFGEDILALVANSKKPRFVQDIRTDPACDRATALKTRGVSEYILPLKDQSDNVLGVMNVDLGDLRGCRLHKAVENVLNAHASAIGASIARVAAEEAARLVAELDVAFTKALDCDTVERGMQTYIEAAVSAFRADGGYVRWWDSSDSRLRLIAGSGSYYEVARQHRERIFTSDRSNSAECFLLRKPILSNDAQGNEQIKAIIESKSAPLELKDELRKIGSIANAPFFLGEKAMGTLTIQSKNPWFFHPHIERCVGELALRAGFLASHLESKRKHGEARSELTRALRKTDNLQREIEALSALWPYLKQSAVADNLSGGLREICIGLRRTLGADVASLYIFNKDISQLVLMAQSGWSDSRWIGAARYKLRQGWAGSAALEDQPRFFEDMRTYKAETYGQIKDKFDHAIWGDIGEGHRNLWGLSIPLRFGSQLLGVATLEAHWDGARPKTVVNENSGMLLAIANYLGAQLAAVLSAIDLDLSSRSQVARDAVLRRFTAAVLSGDPARTLCRGIVEGFHAQEAKFFFQDDAASPIECMAAFPDGASTQLDAGGKQALQTGQCHFLRLPRSANWKDPKEAAQEGVVTNLWVVTPADLGAKGLLAIAWRPSTIQDSQVNEKFIADLTFLGRMVGPTFQRYLRDQEKKKKYLLEKRNDQAIKAMSIMIGNSAHRFKNLLDDMEGARSQIACEGEQAEGLQRIDEILGRAPALVQGPLDLAKKVAGLSRRPCNMNELLQTLIREYSDKDKALVRTYVPENCWAWVEPAVTLEAFRNLVDNALAAVKKKRGGGLLTITATQDSAKGCVEVLFQDTGVGMRADKAAAVQSGFGEQGRERGIGVLLAKVSIEVQEGSFMLQSTENVGTRVVIKLPIPAEDANDCQSVDS